jgi:uncharacterized protein with HEPN domain
MPQNGRFMETKTLKNLHDILNAIEEIDSFFDNQPKVYDEFCKNLMLKRGIERNIEIIGEATNRILKEDDTIHITNARKIVDIRNYISHGYDSVSDDIIWSVVINHLPILKKEVEALLGDN